MQSILAEAFAAPAFQPDWEAQLLRALGCRPTEGPDEIMEVTPPIMAELHTVRPGSRPR